MISIERIHRQVIAQRFVASSKYIFTHNVCDHCFSPYVNGMVSEQFVYCLKHMNLIVTLYSVFYIEHSLVCLVEV